MVSTNTRERRKEKAKEKHNAQDGNAATPRGLVLTNEPHCCRINHTAGSTVRAA
jgi:hypothetical protein